MLWLHLLAALQNQKGPQGLTRDMKADTGDLQDQILNGLILLAFDVAASSDIGQLGPHWPQDICVLWVIHAPGWDSTDARLE